MLYVCYTKKNNVWFGAATQKNQVVATCLSTGKPDLKRLLKRLPRDTAFHVTDNPDQNLIDVLKSLHEVFNGKNWKLHGFGVDINRLSAYSQKVLNCTALIPVGYVTTYGGIAKVAGGIARSVGRVQASNPVPLLIPCHRVVQSDFSIGGYGYGKQVKMEILQRENRGYEESKTIKIGDNELVLFPVERVKQG
ncbi:MAG: methylated-DNA--[protein]-cysteine S-methyltransferase [Candidatus Bathyarchaeota archaeon]|nr:methylated-DNA--[protein]-cysteine S-methyltransferase [Candidatus Bathyarchaeum tardum]WGM89143.1 MAG: methylated-DNA--[protein]-cysteine S-methyltransferase [Candidatus Bathyarchaeum tardum]